MLKQLQQKYRLSILSLLGTVAVLGIFPFAVLRYVEGNITAALIDLGLVLGIFALVGYALRTKETRMSGVIAAILTCGGVVAIVVANGTESFLWVYPTFVGTFFLVKPFEASAINLAAAAALVFVSDIFDTIPLDSFVATTLMLSMCAYVYSNQGVKQLRLLETLNTIDVLTGAMNRRALAADLAAALANSERTGAQQMLVILDLDHFKMVNDKFGHAAGDDVLKQLVTITTTNIRKYDRFYRYGGEEFVLLVSGVDQQQQHGFIANLQGAIKKELKTPDGAAVTASFGVAAWKPGLTPDSWLRQADEALYQAKEQGRNRAVFSDEQRGH